MMRKTQRLQAGFTLVELLIVVIILGVLAAIVIPQFSSSTTDAKEASLDSNLATLRNSIELYKIQHTANIYPGAVATTAGAACAAPAAKGTGAINTAQAWIDSMIRYSDAAGNTCTVGDAVIYKYGPYVRGKIPNDAITGKGSVIADIVVTTTGVPIVPAAATGGWALDTKSGQIVMNSNAADSKAVVYSTH
jgi:general secretion pathway protein G